MKKRSCTRGAGVQVKEGVWHEITHNVSVRHRFVLSLGKDLLQQRQRVWRFTKTPSDQFAESLVTSKYLSSIIRY
eukprot:766632-Hanusia_phi.AAC.4